MPEYVRPRRVQIVPVKFKGEWLASSVYIGGQVVTRNGRTYMSKRTNYGVEPTDGEAWHEILSVVTVNNVLQFNVNTNEVDLVSEVDVVSFEYVTSMVGSILLEGSIQLQNQSDVNAAIVQVRVLATQQGGGVDDTIIDEAIFVDVPAGSSVCVLGFVQGVSPIYGNEGDVKTLVFTLRAETQDIPAGGEVHSRYGTLKAWLVLT